MTASANGTNAIEARGLVKRFGKTTALDGVDLTVRAGTVLGTGGPHLPPPDLAAARNRPAARPSPWARRRAGR